MKKLLLLSLAAAGALMVRAKVQRDAAEQKLWAQATAPVSDA